MVPIMGYNKSVNIMIINQEHSKTNNNVKNNNGNNNNGNNNRLDKIMEIKLYKFL